MISSKLIRLTSIYMLGEILIMAGGFISFPIFTRILTKNEYGTMNLISITLSFVEALTTVGLRHASQRFYSEYNDNGRFQEFYATLVYNSVKFGIIGTLAVISTSYVCGKIFKTVSNTETIFAIASLLIFIRIITKISGCLFRIHNDARTYTFFAVMEKYAGMLLSVFFVTYLAKGVAGFYLGLVIGESCVLVIYIVYLVRKFGFPRAKPSKDMLVEMRRYGMPMIISGIAGTILTMGDRYLIGYFLGAEQVAIYSVPYNLCSYISSILLTAFEFALIPLIMAEWVKPDHGQTDLQLRNAMIIYNLIALPIIFGVIAVGKELIGLVASSQYLSSVVILPYIIIGEIIKVFITPLVIGLQFFKKTYVMAKLTWYAAIFNIILNVALIPSFGLIGSAIATLISYVFLISAGTYVSSKLYRFEIPWKSIACYLCCSVLMMGLINSLKKYAPEIGLVSLISISILSYFILVILIDKSIRIKILRYVI